MTVVCTVQDDDGRLIARLIGRLGMLDVNWVRLHLLKCLAEQPAALLVDVSRMAVTEPLALPVFISVTRQAARWPGTPVLLCGPDPVMTGLLRAPAFRRLLVFASTGAARRHLGGGGHGLPTLTEDLLPISGAARQSRNVATDACLRWDLADLMAPASLICTELVGNAVDHASTMMTLRLSLGNGYLFIAVRDGSALEPVVATPSPGSRRGRGLQLVEATAHSWGCLPTSDGKVVWASLSTAAS